MDAMTLRRDLSLCRIPGQGLLLVGEVDRILVRGEIEEALVEAVGSGGDPASALRSLESAYSSEILERTMVELEQRGILSPATDTLPEEEAAHWEASGVQAAYAERRLGETAVTIRSHCEAGAEELAEAIEALGMTLAPQGNITVAMAGDYLQAELGDRNHHSQPYMLVKPIGTQVWIGPIFVPGMTACYECFRIRLIENRWTDIPFWVQGAALPSPSKARLATTAMIAAALAAQEVARWAVLGNEVAGVLHVFDLAQNTLQRHSVIPRADCPHCAAVGAKMPDAATLTGALQYVSGICGLFQEMRDLTPDAECPVRIHMARYTLPYSMGDASAAMRPAVTVGRGFSGERAKFASLAEAIERRSLYFRGDEKRRRRSYAGGAARAIHPQQMLLFSADQYADRDRLNSNYPVYFQIPEPFDENRELDWTPVQSVLSGEEVLAPTALCYLRHPETLFEGTDSNGCAAGPTRDAALLHGVYELIEREAAAIWWYNRAARPELSQRDLDDPELLLVARYLGNRGMRFYLLDLTTDWEIPVVAALCHYADGSHIAFAFGCHATVERAAKQAATELIQVLAAREKGWEKPIPGLTAASNVADYSYLQPMGVADLIHRPGETISDQLGTIAGRARALGLELLSLDLTRPDTGLPVVRAIIPELCGKTPRFGGRRLYDVPVKLGWLREVCSEESLNPIHLL